MTLNEKYFLTSNRTLARAINMNDHVNQYLTI